MQRARHAHQIRALLAQYEGSLLRYTMRITGDIERARDVVQEAFLRLWARDVEQVAQDIAAQQIGAWLFTVCRHRAIDICRKEHRMHALDSEQIDNYPSQGDSPPQLLERQQQMDHLFSIVQTLPENQRELVYLKFQNGLSYKQISEVTSLSVSHIGVLLHTAMKAIREKMSQQGFLSSLSHVEERRQS